MVTLFAQDPDTSTRVVAIVFGAFLAVLLCWSPTSASGRSSRHLAAPRGRALNVTLIGVVLGFVLYMAVLS